MHPGRRRWSTPRWRASKQLRDLSKKRPGAAPDGCRGRRPTVARIGACQDRPDDPWREVRGGEHRCGRGQPGLLRAAAKLTTAKASLAVKRDHGTRREPARRSCEQGPGGGGSHRGGHGRALTRSMPRSSRWSERDPTGARALLACPAGHHLGAGNTRWGHRHPEWATDID